MYKEDNGKDDAGYLDGSKTKSGIYWGNHSHVVSPPDTLGLTLDSR